MNCIAHILVEPVGFYKQGTALFQFQFNTAIVNMQLFKYLSILTLLVLNACSDNGTSSAPASPPEHSTPPDNGQNPGQEETLYFEKQTDANCTLHSINNAFGDHFCLQKTTTGISA